MVDIEILETMIEVEERMTERKRDEIVYRINSLVDKVAEKKFAVNTLQYEVDALAQAIRELARMESKVEGMKEVLKCINEE